MLTLIFTNQNVAGKILPEIFGKIPNHSETFTTIHVKYDLYFKQISRLITKNNMSS